MRISDILKPSSINADQEPQSAMDLPDQQGSYKPSDTKRFQQISDLQPSASKTYSTAPNEQYAGLDSVTDQAGADSWQGTKHPDDLRGNSFKIYGGN